VGLPVLLLLLAACGPAHVSYKPRKRTYTPPPEAQAAAGAEAAKASPGSLWRAGQGTGQLFTDARAFRLNDLVVVRVEEVADARRSADTKLERETKAGGDLGAFLEVAGTPLVDGNGNASAKAGMGYRGEGSTARSEHLTATVPALVRQVLPNGNLFIEGHRVVLVNNEEQHFYISGVVRPIDIDQQNTVRSTMVADAEIEFTGAGVLTNYQRPGFMHRLLSWLWPF
jgi:flagellar L-ring protein precursor FlgH